MIYENEKFSLIISGRGKLNSAIATTYLLSSRNISNIINFGLAGSSEFKVGEIFLVNKINKNLFPDILISHPFRESQIKCVDEVITKGSFKLVDMESEGFFRASSKFLKIHRIFLLKIVSDNLVCFHPSDEFLKNLILPHKKKILSFLGSLKEKANKFDLSVAEKLSKKYNFSFSQKEQLKNIMLYYALNNWSLPEIDFEKTDRKNDFKRVINVFKKF